MSLSYISTLGALICSGGSCITVSLPFAAASSEVHNGQVRWSGSVAFDGGDLAMGLVTASGSAVATFVGSPSGSGVNGSTWVCPSGLHFTIIYKSSS